MDLNNRGVLRRRGDVEGSVKLLMEAAERVPNLQFLINATKAIFTLLDIKGWDPALARRGLRYLQMAQAKDLRNARVISARELYQRVAREYGVAIVSLANAYRQGEESGGREFRLWPTRSPPPTPLAHQSGFTRGRAPGAAVHRGTLWPVATGSSISDGSPATACATGIPARRGCTGLRSQDSSAVRVGKSTANPMPLATRSRIASLLLTDILIASFTPICARCVSIRPARTRNPFREG
nr:hypothetical protein [Accumulibacter sp.]